MTQERASKKQLEVLAFVDQFIREHDYGPSYREIMTALEYKSVSTVAIHVEALIAKGYLLRKDKSARSLEVVKTQTASQAAAVDHEKLVNDYLRRRVQEAGWSGSQLEQAAKIFDDLGLKELAQSLQPKESDETVA